MQHKFSEKGKIISKALAEVVREERAILGKSQRIFAFEYGVERSLINRIENATNEVKFISICIIAEMLGLKYSQFVAKLENYLPEGFKLLDD